VISSIPVLRALLWGKLNVYDHIVIKNLKGEEMDIEQSLHELLSKGFTNGIHSLIKRNDARVSACVSHMH